MTATPNNEAGGRWDYREIRSGLHPDLWPQLDAMVAAMSAAMRTPAPSARDADGEVVAMHWIDRYASGIDAECQLDRVAEALGGSSDDASDAARYRWLRRALLGAEDDPIDSLLLEKEPETEAEFDAAVDAALAQKGDARGQG